MPELAELKLTADFINHSAKGKVFYGVKKNPTHKCPDIEGDFKMPFTIEAQSRGKELMLIISPIIIDEWLQFKSDTSVTLMMTMGMSGHFKWVDDGVYEKHAHLLFRTEGGSLAFVDVRRFGKWKWGSWGPDRGPDPTTEFQDFIRNIASNLGRKEFERPICEMLMNQKYFNGIGNYLRAEILYRVDVDPFITAREALTNYPEIYQLCRWAPMQAYKLGGGQLRDWENPFGSYKEMMESWDEFILCYGNPMMAKVVDRNGRTFWYDPMKQKVNTIYNT
jgi:endonuclease VIII-like 1